MLKIYGVLGYPAKHSLSPAMHKAAFRALKINAEYKIFEKKPQELEEFIRSLSKENIRGLNVTVPYKEKIIPYLNSISPEAKLIGAVNTVKVSKAGLDGFNTDAEGFLRHLTCDLGFSPKGKIIAIIGAGGAAKAISLILARSCPKRITIFDIDKQKAINLLKRLKENFKRLDLKAADSIDRLGITQADLLVQATPIGMKKSDPSMVDEKLFHRRLLVYDLIYKPQQTRLLSIARRRGAKTSNGLGMLLYQGALSFERFTGRKAPVEVMRDALVSRLAGGKLKARELPTREAGKRGIGIC